jgi:hypothetical protein
MRRPIASCLHDDSHKAANERPLLQVSHSPLCILLIDKLQYEIQGNIDIPMWCLRFSNWGHNSELCTDNMTDLSKYLAEYISVIIIFEIRIFRNEQRRTKLPIATILILSTL